MAHGQRSARHLDDPLRPFAGLTVGQLLALLAGAAAGFGTYKLLARFPPPNGVLGELYIFLVIAAVAAVAGPCMLLAGGQGEPFGAQLVGYLRRRHRYAPRLLHGGQHGSPSAGRSHQARVEPAAHDGTVSSPLRLRPRWWGRLIRGVRPTADSARLLPFPACRQGEVHLEDDGVVALPGGELRLFLAVEPVNFDCCSVADRDLFADLWGSVASALPPGQRLQVLVESRPLAAEPILERMRRDLRLPQLPQERLIAHAEPILERMRRDLRPASPPLREFVDESAAWWAQQLVRSHVPDHRFTLVLSPGPARLRTLGRARRSPERDRAAARRSLDEFARSIEHTLKRRRLACRRLRGEQALQLLWDSLHPGGMPCPAIGTLQQDTTPQGAGTSLDDPDRPLDAARGRRRTIRPGVRVLGPGVLGAAALIALLALGDLVPPSPPSRPRVTAYPRTGSIAAPQVVARTAGLDAAASVATSPVTGRFYPSDNRCRFDTPAGALPAFSRLFSTLNFGGRPFTDHAARPGGVDRPASGHGATAGLRDLSHFNAAFTGTFAVRRSGDVAFTLLVDDAYDLGIAGGARRVRGSLGHPPASGRTALLRLPVVGAFNQGHLAASTVVIVHFPHAGRYAYELDYAECDAGGEALQIRARGQLLPPA